MWLITPVGFFSIVQKLGDKQNDTLTVRSRVNRWSRLRWERWRRQRGHVGNPKDKTRGPNLERNYRRRSLPHTFRNPAASHPPVEKPVDNFVDAAPRRA